MTTRVLVTGATGFVGRTLVPRLLDHGWRVRAAVRQPGRVPNTVEAVTIGDLAESSVDWARLVDGVDLVVHLAARVHVMAERGPDLLTRYRQVNVEPTRRLATAAAAAGVRRMVLMSSIKAMGKQEQARLTENTASEPVDPYGISKLEAETALAAAADGSALQWVVLRPPLVYGPGVGANFLRLLSLAQSGLPLPFGSLHGRRSLIYVGNLVDAILRCLSHPNAVNRCFLLHDGEPLTVSDLIRCLAALMNRPVRLFPLPPLFFRLFTPTLAERLCDNLEIDDSLLRQRIQWVPPFKTEEGLKKTIAWYKEEIGE